MGAPHVGRRAARIATALGLVALAGCGQSGQSTGRPPGTQTLAEALEVESDFATSEFERDVLDRAKERGSIAAADYEEAVSRYLECAGAAGHAIDTVKQPNGIYRWLPRESVDEDAYLDDTYRCAEGTTMIIEALYKLQVMNPDGLDIGTAAVRCLRENGLVDEAYGLEDFNDDAAEGFSGTPFDASGELAVMCLTSLGFGVSE